MKILLQGIDSGSNVPAGPGPSSRGRNRRVPSRFHTGDFIVQADISHGAAFQFPLIATTANTYIATLQQEHSE